MSLAVAYGAVSQAACISAHLPWARAELNHKAAYDYRRDWEIERWAKSRM